MMCAVYLKIICLVSLFIMISTCQDLINGKINCSTTDYTGTDVNYYNACNSDYNSTQRIMEFGVDCCIKEARDSMMKFSKISRKIKLDNNTVTTLNTSTACTSNQLSETQRDALNQILTQFSSTCKRYTDVMALKHLFQCHVFNSQLTTSMISELLKIIINLQSAAINLQRMERAINTNSLCIEFSASQYQYIYTSTGFDELKNRPKIWRKNTHDCCKWDERYKKMYRKINKQ